MLTIQNKRACHDRMTPLGIRKRTDQMLLRIESETAHQFQGLVFQGHSLDQMRTGRGGNTVPATPPSLQLQINCMNI